MRVVTFTTKEHETEWGILHVDYVQAMSGEIPFEQFCARDQSGSSPAAKLMQLSSATSKHYPLGDVRLLAPVLRPGKIVAVGLNYRDHALETNQPIPANPLIFGKFPTSITGPEAEVVLPQGDAEVDYEGELAVVIGRRCKGARLEEAMQFVAGYMPLNDVSARKWQFSDGQWMRGKSCDTFCPTGPWLTTADEVPDPHNLTIETRVNGEVRQHSNTANLIFRIPDLIAYISASITLEPGDIIATGTPGGVGVFRKPPIFLQEGDTVEVEIEKLGVLRNRITAAPAA